LPLFAGWQALEQVGSLTSTIYHVADKMMVDYVFMEEIRNRTRQVVYFPVFGLRAMLCVLHSNNVRGRSTLAPSLPACRMMQNNDRSYQTNGANCICQSVAAAMKVLHALESSGTFRDFSAR
jgi:hypothetical protein